MAKKEKGENIHTHPIYKAFGTFYPTPILAKFNGEKRVFPDAGAYWMATLSKTESYINKLFESLNSLNFQNYWGKPAGLKKLEAETSSKWEDEEYRNSRFKKAMLLKFKQNSMLADLLIKWNPKKEPLFDLYKKDDKPDLIETLISIRKELKE